MARNESPINFLSLLSLFILIPLMSFGETITLERLFELSPKLTLGASEFMGLGLSVPEWSVYSAHQLRVQLGWCADKHI